MIEKLRIDYNVPAKMRDGSVLMANIFQPAEGGPYPVALTRTPYGKDYMTGFPYMDVVRLAQCGFIVVIQDVRGRGGSQGEWELFANEGQDGYDSVEWAASLENSNGSVGMWGFSYLSYTQWAAALLKPPHLKAIIPTFTPTNFYNGVYTRGGALELGILVHLLLNSLGMETLFKRYQGHPQETMQAIGKFIEAVDSIPNGGMDALSLEELKPLKDTDIGIDLIKELVANPFAEKYSQPPYALYDRIAQVDIPSCNIAGWSDIFLQDTINCFTALQENATSSSPSHKLLIGPWAHLNYSSTIGELDFGMKASMTLINGEYDHVGLIQRWFDRWLKDEQNGIDNDPPVKAFISGDNVWQTCEAWPPKKTINIPYYLGADDCLMLEPPHSSEQAHTYDYDPADPLPTCGGSVLMHPYFIPGRRDQHLREGRPDIVRFSSGPLDKKLRVLGPVKVHLWAASSAPDTDFVATLLDIHPDGRAYNLTDGIIRARFRNGAKPEFLTPDQPYEFVIDLWSVGHVFKQGHAIRLDITSSNFPRWDRNHNTGPGAAQDAIQIARQMIFHNGHYQSRLILPVLPWD